MVRRSGVGCSSAVGIFLFFAGARTLQGRIALTAFPIILFGIVLYGWGRHVARIVLFPIAFLLFMVPLNFLTQATMKLQFIETGAASAICNLLGIGVYAVGTTINASNNAFHFTIDEGCSGIRSLMAIAMLSALYAHFTQDRLWKKLAIFAAAIVFALIGNTGRLVSIMVMARFFGQDLAGGPYHWISGYLSFPFALGSDVSVREIAQHPFEEGGGSPCRQGNRGMISKRLFAIELTLLIGLSTIFLLPKAPATSPVGIAMKLPIWVGGWLGEDTQVSPREIEILAKDTQFARKLYTEPGGRQDLCLDRSFR